jgi:hypothetical protein
MTTIGPGGTEPAEDAWRTAILDRLAEDGLKITDPEQQDTIIGMLDAVAFQLSANWLGWLVEQTDDLAVLDERLGLFGSVLATLVDSETEQSMLQPTFLTLDEDTFRTLVVLSLATVKYIDWQAQTQAQAGQADLDESAGLYAAADEAIGAIIERAAQRTTEGDVAAYIATLTPATFVGALLLAAQDQSEALGLGIFI